MCYSFKNRSTKTGVLKHSLFYLIHPKNRQCWEALQITTCSISSFKFLLHLLSICRTTVSGCSGTYIWYIWNMQQPLIKKSFMKQLFKIKYFLPFKSDLPYFKNYTNSIVPILQNWYFITMLFHTWHMYYCS